MLNGEGGGKGTKGRKVGMLRRRRRWWKRRRKVFRNSQWEHKTASTHTHTRNNWEDTWNILHHQRGTVNQCPFLHPKCKPMSWFILSDWVICAGIHTKQSSGTVFSALGLLLSSHGNHWACQRTHLLRFQYSPILLFVKIRNISSHVQYCLHFHLVRHQCSYSGIFVLLSTHFSKEKDDDLYCLYCICGLIFIMFIFFLFKALGK